MINIDISNPLSGLMTAVDLLFAAYAAVWFAGLLFGIIVAIIEWVWKLK